MVYARWYYFATLCLSIFRSFFNRKLTNNDKMQKNDWECMTEGDKNAFLTIYQNHYTSLFHYGFSLTSDKELTKDSIQELFLEIWNTRSSLKKDVLNVRSYLCTWLRRKISRIIYRLDKLKSVGEFYKSMEGTQSSYEDMLIAFQQTEEKKEILNRAINNLSKKQIEIIKLKFFENHSYAAIADKTSLTTRTVYNIIYEAIHHLREDALILQM